MYDEPKKGFLEMLQSLDEKTKQRILVAATAIAMVVVIYFWLAYFNNIVAGISERAVVQNQALGEPAAGAAQSPGIWERIGNGTASLYQYFMGAARSLGDILQAPRQYLIQPPK